VPLQEQCLFLLRRLVRSGRGRLLGFVLATPKKWLKNCQRVTEAGATGAVSFIGWASSFDLAAENVLKKVFKVDRLRSSLGFVFRLGFNAATEELSYDVLEIHALRTCRLDGMHKTYLRLALAAAIMVSLVLVVHACELRHQVDGVAELGMMGTSLSNFDGNAPTTLSWHPCCLSGPSETTMRTLGINARRKSTSSSARWAESARLR
jgi:hypothetical protein